MIIDAKELDYKQLNEALRSTDADCTITNCLGQRFIASGMSDKKITISGVPGNALGAYLNGAEIEVAENAQDAVGDTMNDGTITIYGNVGDAVGYAMRGGKILIKGKTPHNDNRRTLRKLFGRISGRRNNSRSRHRNRRQAYCR